MQGEICDRCDGRRASYSVNVIRVDTDADGKVTTDSRSEDWCVECVKEHRDYWDKTLPQVGETWTDRGTWFKGKEHGTFSHTYTIEDAPRPSRPVHLVPACPCCGEEYTGQDHWEHCAGCVNPAHNHS